MSQWPPDGAFPPPDAGTGDLWRRPDPARSQPRPDSAAWPPASPPPPPSYSPPRWTSEPAPGAWGAASAPSGPAAQRDPTVEQTAGEWGWAPEQSRSPSDTRQAQGGAGAAVSASGFGRDLADLDTALRPSLHADPHGVAELRTTRMPAVGAQPLAHPARRTLGWRTWLARATLIAVLVALGLRANLESLAFMNPGGAIIGWTNPPPSSSILGQLPPAPSSHRWTPQEYAAYIARHLSLTDELAQMLMVQFYASDVTPDLTQMIASQHVGAVLLLGRPVSASDKQLLPELQRLASLPLLTAIDQEGGPVNRFWNVVGPRPSAAQMTDPADAQTRGAQDASLLLQYGFNLDLAPVVDVGTANPQLYGRTFGSDPARVATMADAYLQGLQGSGQVSGVLKHFPGLGATVTDPHLGMPVLTSTRDQWEATDLAPYRTLLSTADVRAIMVTHEMVPAVDANLPASLSPALITDVLRKELGFDGMVITDDFVHMDAITAHWSVAEACVLSVQAGSDMVGALSYASQVQSVLNALSAAVANGTLTRARIDASAQRILATKIRMGLIPLPGPAHPRPQRAVPEEALAGGALIGWVRPLSAARAA